LKLLKYILPLLVISFLLVAPAAMAIQQPTEVNATVNEPEGMANFGNVGVDSITMAVLNVRNWFAGIVLIIAVGVILVGAFLYMTSGGDATKTKTARGWIVGGIIGVVVAAFAYGIVTFVSTIISDFIV
jgi:hypothetical protein